MLLGKPKVAIIGLDGANKTTAELVGITSLHEFISTIPPYTPPSWTSILTGVNPAKHGVIGWQKVQLKENKISLMTSRDVKYPRLSELLESANLKSILINLPMTYPFRGIKKKDNTIIVSDWAAPEQTIFPKKVEEKYREYLVDPPHEWYKHKKREYSKKVKEYTETRLNLYYDLLEKEDWNLYFIVFSEIDWFSHIFPEILRRGDVHLVKPTFKLINEFIETTKSIADFVFIVSDHGFEVKDKIFYVNEALAENGLIEYSKIKSKLVNVAKKIIPSKILVKVVAKTNASVSAVSHSVRTADAFMVEPASWGVYLRNKNKFKDASNILKNYDEVFDVIEVAKIHKGPYLSKMPDLFVIPQKGVEFSHELTGKITEKTYKGDHEIHGVFSAYGEHIKENIKFERRPRVYDIVPTVLHIFNLPIPKDTDGRVLIEIFDENSEIFQRKPKFTRAFIVHEIKKIRKISLFLKNQRISENYANHI
uniref:Phosphodiesterase n=1 Tax=candidate division WOR-3 bacterium TaxID=2052148 RepID=A0A7C2PLW2_UNCW3